MRSKIDEWAVNHHRMVSLGYLGACLALTRSTSGMTKEEIEGLPEVKFFTTESYVVKRINERGLNPVRAGQWTRLLIKSLSNIAENVWMARNGIFHG
jgi:hypothetical protein